MSAAGALAWQDRGLCQYTDPELFFPDKGGSVRDAYRICGQCPVKQECLDYAISNQIYDGVWGGLSYRQRLKVISESRAAA